MSSSKHQHADDADEFDEDCQAIFPQRLMTILSDESNTEAICWLPHGRAFIVRDRALFAERVMPKYFSRKSKYSSFTRKLNRWDFQRVSSGPELGAYYHEFFLRDRPQLAAQMFCKNARTKIAMASSTPPPTARLETPPAGVGGGAAVSQQDPFASKMSPAEKNLAEQKLGGGQDMAHMFLLGNGIDRQTQMLMEQHLKFMKENEEVEKLKLRIQLQQLGVSQMSQLGNRNQLMQQGNATGFDPIALQQQLQEIQNQKMRQVQMGQLQQLMALNMQRQQQKNRRTKNNFRASAA